MARPDIVKGSYVDIMVEDPAMPGTYLILCGLTARTMTEQVNTSDHFIADCADPEDTPVRRLNPTGRQWSIGGEGRHNRSQGALLRQLVDITATYRFSVSEPAADDIDDGYYFGPAMLVNRQIGGSSGESGEFATSSLQIESDGEWDWADAA